MDNFNEESIAKAKQSKSVEDLQTLAKESGVEMTAEQAQDIFAQLNPKSGELADDELDNVAGGGDWITQGQIRWHITDPRGADEILDLELDLENKK